MYMRFPKVFPQLFSKQFSQLFSSDIQTIHRSIMMVMFRESIIFCYGLSNVINYFLELAKSNYKFGVRIMKNKLRRINKGIILLLVLIIITGTISVVDTLKYAARKESAMALSNTFVTDLASLYTWPKNMPDIDAIEFEKNEKKYYSYFDDAYNKIKPYVFDSSVLKEELRSFAMQSIRENLVNEIKPEHVTFTPKIESVTVDKLTASIAGSVSIKITAKGGKIINKTTGFRIHMEYKNEAWVIVGFYPDSNDF